jgi:hypothetical protein
MNCSKLTFFVYFIAGTIAGNDGLRQPTALELKVFY